MTGLGDVNPPHLVGAIRFGQQFLVNLTQKLLCAILSHLVDADAIHAGSPAVGLHSSPGFLQDVQPTDLVVQ